MTRRSSADDGENVLVRFDHEMHESDKAWLLAMSDDDSTGVWFPKSQVADIDFEANEVWIPMWLAEAKRLEYD